MNKNWIVTKVNKKFFIRLGNKIFKCQLGNVGFKIHTKKKEGDMATPIGKWRLKSIYYRSDKVLRPVIKNKTFKINKITKNCGWCDDAKSNYYNKYINIKKSLNIQSINFEKLWREDQAYDVVIETSHNTNPIIKGKGSAIFIHCSFSDYRETGGCIALKKKDLIFLIKNISNKVYIEIKNNF
ncbi:L,D-transpeptidase family protein [Alphaproteobacteria bacterium]|nr:L,D-transpeptidase family protein [Alphaproteobacteria bacterium]